MNSIRQIQELNKRELEAGVSPEASWHTDYRDTAYIYIGGLPFELSEGDIITIFSQFGEPTYINLVRDKESGKSKGFAFLKYEDQRSTDLAVDNLGGTNVMGRMLRVDHTRYKKKEGEAETGTELGIGGVDNDNEGHNKRRKDNGSETESEEVAQRPLIKEERELAKLIEEHDEDDPMKAYLIKEKRAEIALAIAKVNDGKDGETSRRHKNRHRHRSSKEHEGQGEDRRSRHSRRARDHDDSETNNIEESRRARRDDDTIASPKDRRRRTSHSRDRDQHQDRRNRYHEGRSGRADSFDRYRGSHRKS